MPVIKGVIIFCGFVIGMLYLFYGLLKCKNEGFNFKLIDLYKHWFSQGKSFFQLSSGLLIIDGVLIFLITWMLYFVFFN